MTSQKVKKFTCEKWRQVSVRQLHKENVHQWEYDKLDGILPMQRPRLKCGEVLFTKTLGRKRRITAMGVAWVISKSRKLTRWNPKQGCWTRFHAHVYISGTCCRTLDTSQNVVHRPKLGHSTNALLIYGDAANCDELTYHYCGLNHPSSDRLANARLCRRKQNFQKKLKKPLNRHGLVGL